MAVLSGKGVLLLAFPGRPSCQGSPTCSGQRWMIALLALERWVLVGCGVGSAGFLDRVNHWAKVMCFCDDDLCCKTIHLYACEHWVANTECHIKSVGTY